MYTRIFIKFDSCNWRYERVLISEYGFEVYVDDELRREGLVEPEELDEIIEALLDDGWEEEEN